MTPTRLRSLAGLALASTVLLTGCGAVPAFNPGVAARVGDETISVNTVDETTENYCAAAEQQLQEGQVLPQHYLRGQVAGSLALRAAADQFAAERGVTAADDYARAVAEAEESLAAMSEAQRDALIEVQGVSIYVAAIQKSAGEAIFAEEGAAADGGAEAATAAGEEAFLAWLDDHDIRIDPKFGVAIEDGHAVPADTSVSFALGATAKQADAAEPDTEYAAGLPASQRCG